MESSPLPSVLAMLLCDQVIVDEQTKKKSLIGVFDKLNAINFPTLLNCAVYAKLADAEGQYYFKIRIVQLKDETLLGEMEMKGTVQSRVESVEVAVFLMGVTIPEPGKYEIQMYADDVYLGRVTLTAVTVDMPGGIPWQKH
jgi:hypothetical protein